MSSRPRRSWATFRLPEVVPVVERAIAELIARQGRAPRHEIVNAFMADPEGRRLVDAAMFLNADRWPRLQVAGNMVDWFSANFAVGGRLTVSAREQFRREKYLGKWAYFPATGGVSSGPHRSIYQT